MKPVLVGENNPYGPGPEFALYPLPKKSSGWRLCHLVLGMQMTDYLRAFERRNLLAQLRWSAPDARRAALVVLDELPGPLVLLGKKVCDAFRVDYQPFTSWDPPEGRRHVILPHPSGLCRAWNEPGAFERARAVVAPLLAGGDNPAPRV